MLKESLQKITVSYNSDIFIAHNFISSSNHRIIANRVNIVQTGKKRKQKRQNFVWGSKQGETL